MLRNDRILRFTRLMAWSILDELKILDLAPLAARFFRPVKGGETTIQTTRASLSFLMWLALACPDRP